MRANESSRLTLLVITASIAWILFSSSAAIASSIMCLNKSPNAPSGTATNGQASGGQYTTVPTTMPLAIRVAP